MRRATRFPFHLHRLSVRAWKIRTLPADQRRQAGKDLLSEIKHFLDRATHDTPRSDI